MTEQQLTLEQEYAKQVVDVITQDYDIPVDDILMWTTNAQNTSVKVQSYTLARIRLRGKKPYIAFRSSYRKQLEELGIEYYFIDSDQDYLRVEPNLNFESVQLRKLLVSMLDAMLTSNDYFSCCSRYQECSDAKKCIQPNRYLARICRYRKRIKRGDIVF